MKKIYVLGSINMDMVISADRLPLLGETLKGRGFMCNQGGKGANQAIACKKLGCEDVLLIGAVGRDSFGDLLLKSVADYGVDVSQVQRSNTNSGSCVIILDESTKDNVIVLDAGANECVGATTVKDFLSANAQAGDLFITQLEVNLNAVELGLAFAKQKGMYTVLNPAPVIPLKQEIFQNVNLLVLNETESKLLSGVDVVDDASALQCAKHFCQLGVDEVVITLGSNGSYYFGGGDILHCDAVKANAVDTTSAGDTFIGALAYQKAKGKDIAHSLHFASVCSSITVSRKGAAVSIPTYDEVAKILNS